MFIQAYATREKSTYILLILFFIFQQATKIIVNS